MIDAFVWVSAFGAYCFACGVAAGWVSIHAYYRRRYDEAGWVDVETGKSGRDWTCDPRKARPDA